jgi:hypothetical protein
MDYANITTGDNVNPHKLEFAASQNVYKITIMDLEPEYPFAEQGRRLRLLRQAERKGSGVAFAKYLGWNQSGYSQFETGMRRVPAEKALQLVRVIPGFDPLWLWEGNKRGLGFDLRERIEEEEAKEVSSSKKRA